jgi:hypothetical protein
MESQKRNRDGDGDPVITILNNIVERLEETGELTNQERRDFCDRLSEVAGSNKKPKVEPHATVPNQGSKSNDRTATFTNQHQISSAESQSYYGSPTEAFRDALSQMDDGQPSCSVLFSIGVKSILPKEIMGMPQNIAGCLRNWK